MFWVKILCSVRKRFFYVCYISTLFPLQVFTFFMNWLSYVQNSVCKGPNSGVGRLNWVPNQILRVWFNIWAPRALVSPESIMSISFIAFTLRFLLLRVFSRSFWYLYQTSLYKNCNQTVQGFWMDEQHLDTVLLLFCRTAKKTGEDRFKKKFARQTFLNVC